MSGSWAPAPTSGRDLPDPGWAGAPTSGRDLADPGWSTAPVSCRETTFTDLDAGLGIDLDCLSDTGTVTTAHGWTIPTPGSCRDGF